MAQIVAKKCKKIPEGNHLAIYTHINTHWICVLANTSKMILEIELSTKHRTGTLQMTTTTN